MKNLMNNEKGLTLVEVLAVIVIGTLIILLISNTHLFGEKQYKDQSKKMTGLYDVTYAVKVITKEVRKANANNIVVSAEGTSIKLDDQTEYRFNSDDNTIEKQVGASHTIFVNEIRTFNIEKEDSKLIITIESQTEKEIKTEIVLR